MNARRIGIVLAVGWMILPVVACAGAFAFGWLFDDELGIASILMSALISIPFLFGTWIYTTIAADRCISLPRSKLMPRLLLFIPLIAIFTCAIISNALPRRITPDTVSDSPFDKYWYSAPQTSYGAPSPFLRFFDSAEPDRYPIIGHVLFDTSSLLGNLTFWCFVIFIAVSLAYTLLPPKPEGEPRDAP